MQLQCGSVGARAAACACVPAIAATGHWKRGAINRRLASHAAHSHGAELEHPLTAVRDGHSYSGHAVVTTSGQRWADEQLSSQRPCSGTISSPLLRPWLGTRHADTQPTTPTLTAHSNRAARRIAFHHPPAELTALVPSS